jgi:hypothetical protein
MYIETQLWELQKSSEDFIINEQKQNSSAPSRMQDLVSVYLINSITAHSHSRSRLQLPPAAQTSSQFRTCSYCFPLFLAHFFCDVLLFVLLIFLYSRQTCQGFATVITNVFCFSEEDWSPASVRGKYQFTGLWIRWPKFNRESSVPELMLLTTLCSQLKTVCICRDLTLAGGPCGDPTHWVTQPHIVLGGRHITAQYCFWGNWGMNWKSLFPNHKVNEEDESGLDSENLSPYCVLLPVCLQESKSAYQGYILRNQLRS